MALVDQMSGDRLEAISQKLRDSRLVRYTLRTLQIAFVLGVSGFLLNKLNTIGWAELWGALPTHPLYYLFFLANFFAIPVAELLVYRTMWGLPMARYFPVFARKRVYNYALLSYSGEAVFAVWARENLPIKTMTIVQTVKDSNILSALASNSFTLVLLIMFMVTDQIKLITNVDPDYRLYLGLAAAVGIVLVPIILRFRKTLISLDPVTARRVFLIHLIRFVSAQIFLMLQWVVILPEVPITTWLLFVTAQLVLSRVPFLPNTDLLYLGLGLSLATYVDAPDAVVAGMFVAAGALSQILNAGIYILTSVIRPKPGQLQHQGSTTAPTSLASGPEIESDTAGDRQNGVVAPSDQQNGAFAPSDRQNGAFAPGE